MSTVGFGDISAITYFGRTFMIIFISIGLVSEVLGFLLTVLLLLNKLMLRLEGANSVSRLFRGYSTTRFSITKVTKLVI